MLYNDPTFSDHRGSFSAIDCKEWEQTNVSLNTNKYTFRGMHYQTNPPQTKYLKVVQGSIVDILYNLKTKEVRTFQLNNQQAILVDSKYAHGFLTLEDNTTTVNLCITDKKCDIDNNNIPEEELWKKKVLYYNGKILKKIPTNYFL